MYDGNGNRSSVTRNGVASTYSTDSNDKLNFGDGYTFSGYDSNGNPHSIAAGGVTYGLTFDYENQLTQMTYSNGTPTSSFLYNGDNLRVRRTDSAGTTNLLYDGSNLICETNTSGGIVAWYTPGVGFRRAGVPYAYRENALGSTMQVTNNLGLVVNRYEYDAYGVTYTLQQAMTNPHKFAGQHGYYTDGDSGMQLLGHRYYLPSLGRFLTQDPLGHEAGLNLYQYAAQNPLVKIDPTGLDDKPWYDRVGPALNNVISAPFKWAWRKLSDFTRPTMRADAPSLQKAAINAEFPEYGLRFRRAGKEVGRYIDETGAGILQDLVLGSMGHLSKEMLAESRVIARGNRIRDVQELVDQFGGRAKDWVKKSSPVFEHEGRMAEIHWYEHHGIGRRLEKIVYK